MSPSRGTSCEPRALLQPCNPTSEMNIILSSPAYPVPDNTLQSSRVKSSGLHLCAKKHKGLLSTHRRRKTGHRREQRAHTSQIQFEPVHTALRTSPASLPGWQGTRRRSLTSIFGLLTTKGLVKVNGLQTKGI